jgi:hypothetical protein
MRDSYRILANLVAKLDLILVFVASGFVPIFLLTFGIHLRYRNPPFYAWIPLIIGLLTLFIHILYLALERRDQLHGLWIELMSILRVRSAWSIGSGLACLVIGIYFFFPSDSNLANRYQGALGLYLGTLGTTLAIDIFYKKTAPITDIYTLLETILSDLVNSCPDNSRLWFVFPALNIGYYRTLDKCQIEDERNGEMNDNEIYYKFRKEFKEKVRRLGKKSNAKAITYPISLYEPLYSRYEDSHRPKTIQNSRKARIDGCADDAEGLARTEGLIIREIAPEIFPQHVIIIGDIVYTVMSYGLPIYDSATSSFTGGEEALVSLLVYRRKDVTLANKISIHLGEIFSKATNP